MDDVAADMIDRERELADFDHARDDFEDAIGQVPAEALGYKPTGDEYSIGDQIEHVANAMKMYTSVLELMHKVEFEEVRVASYPAGDAETVGGTGDAPLDLYNSSPANMARTGEGGPLDALEVVHDRLAYLLRELAAEKYVQTTPVIYAGAESSYPTSGHDIYVWMSDHYREHTEQTLDMLNRWRKENKA